MVDRAQLAWSAGFFDGEGHTRADGTYSYPKINVGQNHSEPLERLQRIWGCGTINGPYVRKNGCIAYHITVSGSERVQHVIASMWPWLGTAKREQAARVLILARTHRSGRSGYPERPYRTTECPKRHPYNEENTKFFGAKKYKVCRTCHNERGRKWHQKQRSKK